MELARCSVTHLAETLANMASELRNTEERNVQDRAFSRGPTALDTNTRSCSDGLMANTCSLDLEAVTTPMRGAHAAVSLSRPGPHRRLKQAVGHSGTVVVPISTRRPIPRAAVPESPRHLHRTRVQPEGCANEVSAVARSPRRIRRVLLWTLATAIVVLLALPWGGTGGRPLASPGPARVGDPVAAHALYIVQPGDTLWTIAQRLDPQGDPRAVEAELAAEVGGDTIVPGERLVLP
jgi:hypothetical protein